MNSIGQCVFSLGLAERDDFPEKTLRHDLHITTRDEGMKVSGPNLVWQLRQNSINAENTTLVEGTPEREKPYQKTALLKN